MLRLALLFLVGSLLIPALPTESHVATAQIAVKDKRLRKRTKTENKKRAEEITYKLAELVRLIDEARSLAHTAGRLYEVDDVRGLVDAIIGVADELGYSNADFELLYDEIFAGPDAPLDVPTYVTAGHDRLLRSYRSLMEGVQGQMATIEDASLTARRLKWEIENEATNQTKALQLQGAIDVFRAQEMMLVRQALHLQTNVQGLMGAYEANRQALQQATITRSIVP
ncbi:hypothetical protein GGQ19_002555 [Salinibacter ruber]|uniref:hypothetical protein n=1 Tax=Salinibacter ruber TaxID=146919 RepID=UPI002168260C|nr:hypothetical protein [Salinibacter ruber]MCS3751360.1 hypothetical protein [Salinibacter ruber]